MKRVLIVWQDIPEDWWFLPVEVDISEYERLLKFHGHFINADNCSAEMNDMFYTQDGVFRYKAVMTKEPQVHEFFDAVLTMGFIL